jgi:hypothetical protein
MPVTAVVAPEIWTDKRVEKKLNAAVALVVAGGLVITTSIPFTEKT